MIIAEKKAREILSSATLTKLLDQWELTSVMDDPHIPTVRGWLMEEFEKRNPEAFEKWLDGDAEDNQLRFYLTE